MLSAPRIMLDVKLSGGLHRLGENWIVCVYFFDCQNFTDAVKIMLSVILIFFNVSIRIPFYGDDHSSCMIRYSNVTPGLCDSASFPMSQLFGGTSTVWFVNSAWLQNSSIDHKAVFMTISGLGVITLIVVDIIILSCCFIWTSFPTGSVLLQKEFQTAWTSSVSTSHFWRRSLYAGSVFCW